MYTGLTKAGPFPEFIAEAESDDKQIVRYSNEKRAWERDNLTVDDWNKAPAEPPETREEFLNDLYDLSKCKLTAECSEFHVLQRIIGCEVVKRLDGTVTNLNAFDKSAYDGKDFTIYKYNQPLPWMDKVIETKMDHQTGRNPFLTDFLTNCMNWISTFNNTYKNSPDVYISARKAPHDQHKLVLTCSATSFYPRDIEMNIRLNESILDNQMCSEIRPNANETFQMNTSAEIDKNFKGSYDCFVIHGSLTEPASVEWDGKCSTFETESQWSFIVGLTVPVLAVILVLALIAICHKGPNESFLALGRNHHRDYGAVSEQIPMTDAACADASDEELSVDESADQTAV
ncbi:zinc-alpha-2-glycoprotein-like [Sinocyclocheilus rhinocerous]|uniref:zinc-alpha-2-glycoprotein-like n=1 Tax=Sinocyclocheilus rhinocerous TaxID=307959 RepID=UPI0007BA5648|nr:PREDICTED: zinc-alpha-2-glycoprotein-like [Sinocyclocheilus rhinocerous]